MNEWKQAVATETARLISKGWPAEAAARRARKVCRHLHPAHKVATGRRIEVADTAQTMTGKFHSM